MKALESGSENAFILSLKIESQTREGKPYFQLDQRDLYLKVLTPRRGLIESKHLHLDKIQVEAETPQRRHIYCCTNTTTYYYYSSALLYTMK